MVTNHQFNYFIRIWRGWYIWTINIRRNIGKTETSKLFTIWTSLGHTQGCNSILNRTLPIAPLSWGLFPIRIITKIRLIYREIPSNAVAKRSALNMNARHALGLMSRLKRTRVRQSISATAPPFFSLFFCQSGQLRNTASFANFNNSTNEGKKIFEGRNSNFESPVPAIDLTDLTHFRIKPMIQFAEFQTEKNGNSGKN